MNAYYSLYFAIKNIIKVMSPILPFITDYIWRNLVLEIEQNEENSVHLTQFPVLESFGFEKLVDNIEKSREIIYLGSKLRNEHKIKVKQPLSTMYLVVNDEYKNAILSLEDIVKDELNIKNIEFEENNDKFNTKELVLNFKEAGKVLGKDVPKYQQALKNANSEQMKAYCEEYETKNTVTIDGLEVQNGNIFTLKYLPKEEFAISIENNNVVALDITLTKTLLEEGYYREITRQVQVARKDANFKIEDRIILNLSSRDNEMQEVINKFMSNIMEETLAVNSNNLENPEYQTNFKVNDVEISLKISRAN